MSDASAGPPTRLSASRLEHAVRASPGIPATRLQDECGPRRRVCPVSAARDVGNAASVARTVTRALLRW